MQKTCTLLCDQLIHVLLPKNDIAELRNILSNSQLWSSISEEVFLRLDQIAEMKHSDSQYSTSIRTMRKNLVNIDMELKLYNKIINDFRTSIPSEYFALLMKHRDNLKRPFFEHIESLTIIARRKGFQGEEDSLKILKTKIIALVDSYNYAIMDKGKVQNALIQLQNLLNHTTALDEAEKKIDVMASSCQLDPSFLLVISRVYSSIKESPYASSEIADVAMHLYFRAQGQILKNMPKEVRILKYLLSLEDPLLFKSELDRALNPGPVVETKTADYIHSKPDRLLLTVNAILKAHEKQNLVYVSSKRSKLFRPSIINRLITVRKMLIAKYLD